MATLIQRALAARYAVIHVMGDRGGEKSENIIQRKADDIRNRGAKFTFWSQHSRRATPEQVTSMCRRGDAFLYLVADVRRPKHREASTIRMPGEPTKGEHRCATHYQYWNKPPGAWQVIADLHLGPVRDATKYLDRENGRALVLGQIELLDHPFPIRMQDWADIGDENPMPARTGQGYCVVCAERQDMRHHPEVWRKERVIIAVAPLVAPYAVWLK
jgi:hypothetical protein